MPDNNPVKSRRDTVKERMRAKYPDKDFEDEEELFGRISDDYDEYDQKISASEERERAFSDMFTSDPRSARLMMEWKDGNDPAIALLRIYGDDIMEAVNDPEKQEAIMEANKEFAERVAKEKEYTETYERNLEASLKRLEQTAQTRGIDDDTIDEAMSKYAEMARNFMMGDITDEAIDLMLKAINYDTDVENAAAEGEVAGRNARIEERLRKRDSGDGTIALDGKNSVGASHPPARDLGALDRFSSQSIYERGGEKRIKH